MHENSIPGLFLLIIGIFLTGCGVKASPSIPSQIILPEVKDLKYDLKDSVLNLTWTIPGTEDEKAVLKSFRVYRLKKSLAENECKKCPVLYESSGKIIIKDEDLEKGRISYTEILEKGHDYTYKVVGYTKKETAGNDSNTINFIY